MSALISALFLIKVSKRKFRWYFGRRVVCFSLSLTLKSPKKLYENNLFRDLLLTLCGHNTDSA